MLFYERRLMMMTPHAKPTNTMHTIQHILPQAGDVVLRDALRKTQLLCHMQRDADLQRYSTIADAMCKAHEKSRTCTMHNMVVPCWAAGNVPAQ
jgi:hypothetical protein